MELGIESQKPNKITWKETSCPIHAPHAPEDLCGKCKNYGAAMKLLPDRRTILGNMTYLHNVCLKVKHYKHKDQQQTSNNIINLKAHEQNPENGRYGTLEHKPSLTI